MAYCPKQDGARAGKLPDGALKGRPGIQSEYRKGDPELGKRLAVQQLHNAHQRNQILTEIAAIPDAMDHLEAALSQVSPILDPFSFSAIFACLGNCICGGAKFPGISQRAVNILDKAIKADAIPRWRSALFKKIVALRKNLESELNYLQLRLEPTAYDSFKTDEERRAATIQIEYLRSVLSKLKY